MIRIISIAASLLACCASAPAAFPRAFRPPNPYGDARTAAEVALTNQSGMLLYDITIPEGRHQGLTVIGWFRVPDSKSMRLTTAAQWCCDPIQYANPDLADKVFGWGVGGVDLDYYEGSVTIAEFPWQPYTDATLSNTWPRGVYTLAGTSSNAVTITLGGTDYVCGPGEFNRNAVPGPADSVVLSGTGWAEVGISRTPGHQFFGAVDGVQLDDSFTRESMVTNELTMCVWRWRMTSTNQIYQSNLGRMESWQDVSQSRPMDLPGCGAYDSRGLYRIGLSGLGGGGSAAVDIDIFDLRVFDWCLTDAEIDRVHLNSVLEIQRRGIPRWRTP